MNSKTSARLVFFGALACGIGLPILSNIWGNLPSDTNKPTKLGDPLPGLTTDQLRKFEICKAVFKKEFTPEQGLGPLFNGKSCFECHGQHTLEPESVGGEGRDVAGTGVVRIGRLNPASPLSKKPKKEIAHLTTVSDVDGFALEGGPALERKSITSEFPNKYPADCQVEIGTIPVNCDFISMRHAPPVFGFGLVEALDDSTLTSNVFREVDRNPKMAGQSLSENDPLTKSFRIGRFGWKCQRPNLTLMGAEALDAELGITTPVLLHPKSAKGLSAFPAHLLAMMPPEPNDPDGKIMIQLAYFMAMLAPPARGPITPQVTRGGKVFDKLECSVCHMPELTTKSQVLIADPESPFPKLNYMEIKALENKPVRAYSDFLVHNMGPELADGLPQASASGGEWRTTPLWGLRFKKFLLHDGRAGNDLFKVISLHHGQAEDSLQAFNKLDQHDKDDLMAFLRSL